MSFIWRLKLFIVEVVRYFGIAYQANAFNINSYMQILATNSEAAMSYNSDFEYARRLQAEFDSEEAGTVSKRISTNII